jgi:hypothetical protein
MSLLPYAVFPLLLPSFAVQSLQLSFTRDSHSFRPDKIMCPYEIGCKQGCALSVLV